MTMPANRIRQLRSAIHPLAHLADLPNLSLSSTTRTDNGEIHTHDPGQVRTAAAAGPAGLSRLPEAQGEHGPWPKPCSRTWSDSRPRNDARMSEPSVRVLSARPEKERLERGSRIQLVDMTSVKQTGRRSSMFRRRCLRANPRTRLARHDHEAMNGPWTRRPPMRISSVT